MKILITGASGFVGKALCKELLSRNPSQQPPQKGMHWSTLPEAPEAEAVVHLAGENVFGIWTQSKKQRVYQSRIQGTQDLLKTIASWNQKPSVLIGASAVGIYGDRGEESLEDTSLPDPQKGYLAQVCIDWENETQKAKAMGIRTVLTRIGLVMDPSDGMLGKQWLTFRLKTALLPGTPEGYIPWISRNDLVRLIIFSLKNPNLEGPLNATSPNPVRGKEWLQGLDTYFRFWIQGFIPRPFLSPLGAEFCKVLYSSQKVFPTKLLQQGFQFQDSTWEHYLATLFSKK
jgi:uncharacterized protein